MFGQLAVRRLAQGLLVIWLLSVISFGLSRLNGDPARLLAAQGASADQVEQLRDTMGLNRPLIEQYLTFIFGAFRGDLGLSLSYRQPVSTLIVERLPATLELGVAAVALAAGFGVSIGLVIATTKNHLLRGVLHSISLIGQSVPVFWLALILISFVSVTLRLLPSSGRHGIESLILPAVALAAYPTAQIARLIAARMTEAGRLQFVRAARAGGIPEGQITFHYVLRYSLPTVITVIALQLGAVLGGAIITEAIFAWPGLGSLSVSAVNARDFPLVQGIVITIGIMIVLVNLAADLLCLALDPRAGVAQ